jgi:predicted  nucleic acid-binding Zn-ribbon protein
MTYSQEVKDKLRADYINHRLPIKKAAEINEVPYNTARRWRTKAKEQGDDWDTARAASTLVKSGMQQVAGRFMEDFIRLYQYTVDELNKQIENQEHSFDPIETAGALAKIADAFTKTSKSVAASSPSFGRLQIAHEVIEALTHHLRDEHPEKLQEWVVLLQGFSRKVAKIFAD